MPEAMSSIFNKKATDKLRNPDDLERCIQVTNPSVWAVLIACIALLVGLLSWGVFGSVTTRVVATGTVVDGQATCFLSADHVAKVHVGDNANFGGTLVSVSEIAAVPLSRNEAHNELGSDYLASALLPGDWAYQVDFSGDVSGLVPGIPQTVDITVEQIAPLSLILENWG